MTLVSACSAEVQAELVKQDKITPEQFPTAHIGYLMINTRMPDLHFGA